MTEISTSTFTPEAKVSAWQRTSRVAAATAALGLALGATGCDGNEPTPTPPPTEWAASPLPSETSGDIAPSSYPKLDKYGNYSQWVDLIQLEGSGVQYGRRLRLIATFACSIGTEVNSSEKQWRAFQGFLNHEYPIAWDVYNSQLKKWPTGNWVIDKSAELRLPPSLRTLRSMFPTRRNRRPVKSL